MKIDIRGRVDNLKLSPSHHLRPVFEAIVNSIHAINDRGISNGRITIVVARDTFQGVMREELRRSDPVVDFEIRDNGIGFNEENFDSFSTSDSRYKAEHGGKGIGRLLWLKAFSRVVVNSVFEVNGEHLRRTFDFAYSEAGVENNK